MSVAKHPSYVLADSKAVVHNCHRIGAGTWSLVPPKFAARFRIGLSATPRRKDGADNVFLYHIGPLLFTAHEQRLKPKVRRVQTDLTIFPTARLNPDSAPKSVLLKFLCGNKARNSLIVDRLIQAIQAGRKAIVLSERLKHLEVLEAEFKVTWDARDLGQTPSTGYYVGGMKEEEREASESCTVIFATSQMASEGLDIPALDTLFLTTPLGDVEQAVGRIMRPYEGKKEPIVVDFQDPHVGLFARLAHNRERQYKRIAA